MKTNIFHSATQRRNGGVRLLSLAAGCLLTLCAQAQLSVNVSTVLPGLAEPYNVVLDSANNMYISESAADDIIGVDGLTGTPFVLASLDYFATPQGLLKVQLSGSLAATYGTNGLLVSESGGSIIQFISLDSSSYGAVSTIAGADHSFSNPVGMDQDGAGNVYFADFGNNAIKVLSLADFTVTSLAVTNAGFSFFRPSAVAYAGTNGGGYGQLWVADTFNQQVELITLTTRTNGSLAVSLGSVTHARGSSDGTNAVARFNNPSGLLWLKSVGLIISDSGNDTLRLATNAGAGKYAVATIAGEAGTVGLVNGDGFTARFNSPFGMATDVIDNGFLVADLQNDAIRLVQLSGVTLPPNSLFSSPQGVALDPTSTLLYVADQGNNAVQVLDSAANTNAISTFLTAANGLNQPVDVLVDAAGDVFVLNQGPGVKGGYILEFDRFGNLLATNAVALSSPTAFTVDGSGNLFVALRGGTIKEIIAGQVFNVATVTNAGVQLQGIVLFNDGGLAVSDAGNHAIWQVDAVTRAVTLLTGQPGVSGTTLGSSSSAKLNQPHHLAGAANNLVVVADTGNNRLVVMDRSGSVTNVLNSGNSRTWYGSNDGPYATNSIRFLPMRLPVGAVVGGGGAVFTSEDLYNDIRELLATGLSQPLLLGTNISGGTTNVFLNPPPSISPNSGYFPMGQLIQVVCPYPTYYTTDGTDPTINSPQVQMSQNVGFINWFGTLKDLSSLRVKAFLGVNSSVTVDGQPVTVNNVGIAPAPTPSGAIYAGIGSTIVVPVVANLNTNSQVRSYQFRIEIVPNGASAPIPSGPSDFFALSLTPNDFISLVSPLQGTVAGGAVTNIAYTVGITNGLAVFAPSNSGVSFKNFAVVSLIKIPIPFTANVGDSYSIYVSGPSATSDGLNSNLPLAPMVSATILVTNVPYVVGDSASTNGTWYNAGGFGDGLLLNNDVNNAFYAASGLRVPYAFSDVFNAMDAYPPDTTGFVGGDGQIRFLDWTTILFRSLGLDTANWTRQWSAGGNLINTTNANPVVPHIRSNTTGPWPWYRQALVGGSSVSFATPGAGVSVPVYVKLADGSSLAGLQFRAVVNPQNGAPALATSPQFTPASGVPGVWGQQSFSPGTTAFGWQLGAFNYQSRSSNFLGWVSFTIPAGASAGQGYVLSFANADGAPDFNTEYDFESRSANVTVGAVAAPSSICSDEWKAHFFGSSANPAAGDLADPDGDGVPNWMEYLAGTDPTDPGSKLHFIGAQKQIANGHPQVVASWLSAPGKAYEVQWAGTPISGAWSSLTNLSGSGGVISCADTNSTASARYYRLRVLP